MNIGQASKACGLPTKTIRYYETIGLVVADRRSNGYRYYTAEKIRKLNLLHRARGLGFSIAECRSLLSLCQDNQCGGAEVQRLAEARLVDVDRKIEELRNMHSELARILHPSRNTLEQGCSIVSDKKT